MGKTPPKDKTPSMGRILSQRLVTCSLLLATLVLCSSCLYKMPEEDFVDLRPMTNNPNVVKQMEGQWMPGATY